MQRLLSHINLLNILLAGLLALAAQRTVMPFLSVDVKSVLPAPKKTAAQPAAKAKPDEIKTPSPADYVVIAEQNLFHPDRKIPVDKKEAQPLPKPEFVLYGTVRAGDVTVAYMEDKKHPVSTPTRGKKQIPLRMGQSLSGFTVQAIEADRVVMQRGEEKIVVELNDSHAPKTRETAGAGPVAGHAPGTPAVTAQQAVQQRASRRQEAMATRQANVAPPEAPTVSPEAPTPPATGTQPAARPQRPANPVNIFKNFLKPKQ